MHDLFMFMSLQCCAARSEDALLLLKRTLQTTFGDLILKPEIARETEPRPRLRESLQFIKTLIEKRLENYMDFVLVKANERLSITSYPFKGNMSFP